MLGPTYSVQKLMAASQKEVILDGDLIPKYKFCRNKLLRGREINDYGKIINGC